MISHQFARRELLRLGAIAGLGTALMPRLALAASAPELAFKVVEVLSRWVGPGKFPGLVASIGLSGRNAYFLRRGTEGFTDKDPMSPDSLFRIYSMTKPITGMAAMILIDEGRMGLDQPVADILPAFARMQVQDTPDGSITQLHPAKTPMTMRHLVTHTSGLGYAIIQQGPLRDEMIRRGLVSGRVSRTPVMDLDRGKPVHSLKAFADGMATVPLVYEPGTKWSYSTGLDVMGRVIEVVSGQPFDVFLAERIFGPAKMTSTFFQVPARDAHRLTTNYFVKDSKLVAIDKGSDSVYLDKPPYPMGGSGLVSSPRDYDRFLMMLANYGLLDGERIMSKKAVTLGTGNLLPDGVEGPTIMGPRSLFGAGGRVGIGPEAGIYGWAGAAGTVASVDMKRGVRTQIYAQFMPPTALPFLGEMEQALHSDLMALAEAA